MFWRHLFLSFISERFDWPMRSIFFSLQCKFSEPADGNYLNYFRIDHLVVRDPSDDRFGERRLDDGLSDFPQSSGRRRKLDSISRPVHSHRDRRPAVFCCATATIATIGRSRLLTTPEKPRGDHSLELFVCYRFRCLSMTQTTERKID